MLQFITYDCLPGRDSAQAPPTKASRALIGWQEYCRVLHARFFQQFWIREMLPASSCMQVFGDIFLAQYKYCMKYCLV